MHTILNPRRRLTLPWWFACLNASPSAALMQQIVDETRVLEHKLLADNQSQIVRAFLRAFWAAPLQSPGQLLGFETLISASLSCLLPSVDGVRVRSVAGSPTVRRVIVISNRVRDWRRLRATLLNAGWPIDIPLSFMYPEDFWTPTSRRISRRSLKRAHAVIGDLPSNAFSPLGSLGAEFGELAWAGANLSAHLRELTFGARTFMPRPSPSDQARLFSSPSLAVKSWAFENLHRWGRA